MSHKLYVIGVGPGRSDQLTLAARETINSAGLVVAAPRHLPLAAPTPRTLVMGKFGETFDAIRKALETRSVALLVSGDTGVYSLLPLVKKNFPAEIIEVIPGISSLQTLCALTRTTWIDAVILSGHGRQISEAKVLDAADQNAKVIFFCGPEWPPHRVCRLLVAAGMEGLKVTVGERLSYDDQRVASGRPSDLAGEEYDDLALVLIENPAPWTPPTGRPRDDDFIRTNVPMTREVVRSAVIDELRLEKDSTLWDLGAGTGSISVAAALICRDGHVCAVEKKPDAVDLIERNVAKFHLHNLSVHAGDNLELLPSLPRPTHVFIGGSGAETPDILRAIAALGPGIRVVVSAVAFKTYAAASEILDSPIYADFDALQVAVSHAKKVGSTHIMAALNPITLFTAVTA